ncbi:MAG: lamin tail domain-containing protein, partial [Akkermansiaceae bacterium]|nr:lamin tail domain-containing protein [Akkermansiaceae bacterium]
ASPGSSDIVFDCELTAVETIPARPDPLEADMMDLLDYLRITEVMYNPPDGKDAEFIELRNISDSTTLNLTGVRLTEGVTFTFPPFSLGPGEHIVVINNLGMFRVVHGDGIKVAGEFNSKLENGS